MASQFTCTSTNNNGTAVVRPTGDVDLATVDELWLHVAYHLNPSALVVLDCSGITFFGTAGLHLIERADSAARELGGLFVLACVGECVSLLLRLADLTGTFATVPTVADAIDPLQRAKDVHGASYWTPGPDRGLATG
ncbi:anti-sigma B factor antagonist [Catenulispora sp. GP43]|uniref:STAS domain-containing protein n=1 Tax=Catenulispora sp. GP43 TaxID=3156263 RepID=UPI0035135CD6